MIFITGAAGFIGSNFAHYLASKGFEDVVILDKLTYAGNMDNLDGLKYPVKGVDIADDYELTRLFSKYKPRIIFNFAAETHVDNSINNVYPFLDTNVVGTVNLLNLALKYDVQKFHHISTDEVYGALGYEDPPFTEETPYDPQNPYSASKAASDHFVTAFHNTYSLPTVITNCSNNYGPRQHHEKLIPKTIKNILDGKKIPVYAKGQNIRNNPDVEAVLKDMTTNLNLPVVIKTKGSGFEVTNKTIMRKKDFKTTSKIIRYEDYKK